MKIFPDCIPCILQVSFSAIRRVTEDLDQQKGLLKEVLKIPPLKGEQWDVTSAEVVERVFEIISTHSGNKDPYRPDKKRLNESLLEIYQEFKDLVHSSDDPCLTAMKLSILGNSMDAMVNDNPVELVRLLQQKARNMSLPQDTYAELEKTLKSANTVIVFGDNAGEIVLDKLFIETLRERYSIDFIYVVRNEPTLTDVTHDDARAVGMDEVATVIENGIVGPLPGTILERCSPQIRRLVIDADLIVSKGGGNFETLSEASIGYKPCFFLLTSKCRVYCSQFSTSMNQAIVHHMLL